MKKLMGVLALALLMAVPAHADAQGTMVGVPDLSGRWVSQPIPDYPSPVILGDRCDQIYGGRSNAPNHGYFSIDLSFDHYEQRLINSFWYSYYYYKGTATYWQSYSSRTEELDAGGSPTGNWVWDNYCHAEIITYDITGAYQTGGGSVRLYFGGLEQSSSPYRHPVTLSVNGGMEGGDTPRWDLTFEQAPFTDEIGDTLNVVVRGWDIDPRGPMPEGCGYFGDVKAGQYDISRCRIHTDYNMKLVLGAEPPDFTPRGPITGTLLEALPDETPTGETLSGGEIILYQLKEPLRSRGAGESDASWGSYLATVQSVFATTTADAEGNFRFEKVPVLEPLELPGRKAYKRAIFSIVVKDVEKDEPDLSKPPPATVSLPFASKRVPLIKANGDAQILLVPFGAIATKRQLIERLSTLSPNQYAPIEAEVSTYLSQIEAAGTLTDVRLEAINRAVWSERAVLMGMQLAKDMIDIMVDQFLDAVNDFVIAGRFNLRSKRQKVMERKLDRLKAAQQFDRDNANTFAAGLGWGDPATQAELQGNISKMVKDNPGLKDNFLIDMFKKAVKVPLALIKKGLTNLGLGKDGATLLVDIIEKGVFHALDAASGDLGGVVKEVVKLFGDPIKKELFDAQLAIFPSYCGMTSSSLAYSRDEMQSWTTYDRATYTADRRQTVVAISEMTNEAGLVLQTAYFLKAIEKGFGDAADIYDKGKANPIVRAAAIIAKVIKNFARVGVFVVPAVEAFGRMPGNVEKAAYAAYGQPPPPFTWPPVVTGNPLVAGAKSAFDTAMAQLQTQATDLKANVVADDETREALAAVGAPGGVMETLENVNETATSLVGQLSAADDLSPAVQRSTLESMASLAELQAAGSDLMDGLAELSLDQIDGIYSSPTDGLYLARRYDLGYKATVFSRRLQQLESAMNSAYSAHANAGGMIYPLVAIHPLTIETAAGETEISLGTQTFTVTAVLENMSSVAVNVDTVLAEITSQKPGATITAPAELPVGILNAGAISSPFTWTLEWSGDPMLALPVTVSVSLLEAGAAPVSFQSQARTGLLTVALAAWDPDGDGLPSAWESSVGLDPLVDDGAEDPDTDGLINEEEYLLATDPGNPDTDGDGLEDGAEAGGASGIPTDPTEADTDGDGVPDGTDLAPLDPSETLVAPTPDEPVVALSKNEVFIHGQLNRVLPVLVTNAGGGKLSWSARSSDPTLIDVDPRPGILGDEGEMLAVQLGRVPMTRNGSLIEPYFIHRDLRGRSVTVEVTDRSGAIPDTQELTVWLYEKPGAAGDGGTGDAGPADGGDGGQPDAGSPDAGTPDAGPSDAGGGNDGGIIINPPPPDDGGCGCQGGSGEARPLALLLGLGGLALFGIRRRRVG